MHQDHKIKNKRRLRGDTLILVTVFLVALFGFASLSIDVSNVFQKQRAANIGTDAASLAAVMLLTNSTQNVGSITAEATAAAAANGVTAAEIAASSAGAVQPGYWNGTNFSTSGSGKFNAVNVPAKRTVPLAFGKVVGISVMAPAVHSVAALTPTGRTTGAIPFGISSNAVPADAEFGDTLDLNVAQGSAGGWGKIDLGGYQNPGAWQGDMDTNGYAGEVSVGPVPTITGNAQVDQTFNALGQIQPPPILIIPIIAGFFDVTGNSDSVNIIGFIVAELLSSSGNGNNWSAQVRFIDRVIGDAGGGLCPEPCVRARTLVE